MNNVISLAAWKRDLTKYDVRFDQIVAILPSPEQYDKGLERAACEIMERKSLSNGEAYWAAAWKAAGIRWGLDDE